MELFISFLKTIGTITLGIALCYEFVIICGLIHWSIASSKVTLYCDEWEVFGYGYRIVQQEKVVSIKIGRIL